MRATPEFTRRTGLRLLLPLLAGGGTAIGAVYRGTSPAVAVSDGDGKAFDATDAPTVERNDGRVRSVTVTPEIDVDWRDFGRGVAEIELRLAASVDGAMDVLAESSLASGADTDRGRISDVDGAFDRVDGTATVSFEPLDVTQLGDSITEETFGDPDLQADQSTTTTVELHLAVEVRGNEAEHEKAVETASFDVTVHNPDGAAGFSGEVNPDAS